MEDPYDTAKSQLEADMVNMRNDLDILFTELGSTTRCICDVTKGIQLARTVGQFGEKVATLSQTVEVAAANPTRFRLTAAQVETRKSFIQQCLIFATDFEKRLNHSRTEAKRRCHIHSPGLARAALFERSAANTEFARNEREHQQEIERMQDKMLTEIAVSASRLNATARAMNEELGSHQVILEGFDSEVDETGVALGGVMRRMALVLKTNNRRQLKQVLYLSLSLIIMTLLLII